MDGRNVLFGNQWPVFFICACHRTYKIKEKMPVFKIKGSIQNYSWGGSSFIPGLLGQRPTGEKCAEYWMGAHDKSPARINETGVFLNELIDNDPTGTLGREVYRRFGRLPYLFKVLDVNDILSIQVHPSKSSAEKGFARENAQGVPLDAPFRNYKDDNHKPEIMVALGEFWLLHGFKPKDKLRRTLEDTPELNHLLPVFEQSGHKGLYRRAMEEPPSRTNSTLRPLIGRILPGYRDGLLDKASPDYWAAKAFLTFCPAGDLDKGLYSIYFFNIVKVGPGEAVFQDAGVPHAYMEGQNLELMANSDNVLRGGMTPKHVDVPELLKHIVFSGTIPHIIKGDLLPGGMERVYKSPAPDFELSKIELSPGASYIARADTFEILIVLEGRAKVSFGKGKFKVSKGEAFSVTARTGYELSLGPAVLYKAKCPVK